MNIPELLHYQFPDDGQTVVRRVGRVSQIRNGVIFVEGLASHARIADRIMITVCPEERILGEVIAIGNEELEIMPDGSIDGIGIGARAELRPPLHIRPCNAWLGRTLNANGDALDGLPLKKSSQRRSIHASPPPAAQRGKLGERLRTGTFALNTLLPLVKGQRVGLFSGSGVGKSSLIATLAQNVDCDVSIICLVGERGREVKHVTDNILAPMGQTKTIVVAATSDRPALERRRSVWTAMATAEYFRDQGKSVLLLVDSITRFAEAHREIATAAGELPALRGYPSSVAQAITDICERAGPGAIQDGSITAVFSVLVPGSDMDEPVADILRGVLDGHIVLSRDIADRGRYPAIDLNKSISRSLPEAASEQENDLIISVRKIMSTYEDNALMIKSGLYTSGTDKDIDTALSVWPEVDQFIGTVGPQSPSQCFDKLRMIMRRGGAI